MKEFLLISEEDFFFKLQEQYYRYFEDNGIEDYPVFDKDMYIVTLIKWNIHLFPIFDNKTGDYVLSHVCYATIYLEDIPYMQLSSRTTALYFEAEVWDYIYEKYIWIIDEHAFSKAEGQIKSVKDEFWKKNYIYTKHIIESLWNFSKDSKKFDLSTYYNNDYTRFFSDEYKFIIEYFNSLFEV